MIFILKILWQTETSTWETWIKVFLDQSASHLSLLILYANQIWSLSFQGLKGRLVRWLLFSAGSSGSLRPATAVYCQRCPAHGILSVDLTPRFWTWIGVATDHWPADPRGARERAFVFAIKRLMTGWRMVELFCSAALSAAETDQRTYSTEHLSHCLTSSSHHTIQPEILTGRSQCRSLSCITPASCWL